MIDISGVLRIFFTNKDLAGTRVAAVPDPLWETVLSLQALQNRLGGADIASWRRWARAPLIAAATSSDDLRGEWCGRELRSSSPARPSDR